RSNRRGPVGARFRALRRDPGRRRRTRACGQDVPRAALHQSCPKADAVTVCETPRPVAVTGIGRPRSEPRPGAWLLAAEALSSGAQDRLLGTGKCGCGKCARTGKVAADVELVSWGGGDGAHKSIVARQVILHQAVLAAGQVVFDEMNEKVGLPHGADPMGALGSIAEQHEPL